MGKNSEKQSVNEFEMIENIFTPLAANAQAARGLKDDAALIYPCTDSLVVTKDVLVENVHFLNDDPPEMIAKKALRVNLSDLAAKGATPFAYFIGCVWPRRRGKNYIESFVDGLREDQKTYRVRLFGGDTTFADAPMMISVTALGEASSAGAPARAGAKPGDDLWVTGTIGDAGLGLRVLQEKIRMNPKVEAALADRYRLPQPPVPFANVVAEHASASIDVSDGLFADARHIAAASAVDIRLFALEIPLSPETTRWAERRGDPLNARLMLAAFGDDYQILFTASAAHRDALSSKADAAGLRLTRIGVAGAGSGELIVEDERGAVLPIAKFGWEHKGRADERKS